MKTLTLLGSTGSIGTQCLDIVRKNREEYRVGVLTCGSNVELLSRQIEEFAPELAVTARAEDAAALAKKHPRTQLAWGRGGLIAAARADCDMVVNALMGLRGLAPTYNAIMAGHDVALANKETLVAGGQLIMPLARERGVRLLPVDSEHSAIFQCLEGNEGRQVRKILLTASGGPFRGFSRAQLAKVTPAQALKHPNWSMGQKITIDSATMMNKGLEVIEARWLFDVPAEKIEVLVHPQSILHSAVEFCDGAVIGQLGRPDMRIPISFALAYPKRLASDEPGPDFFGADAQLTFEKPDTEVFRCLKLAFAAIKAGGTYPVVLNGANEVLVELFLAGKIGFLAIEEILDRLLAKHVPADGTDLADILAVDEKARRDARAEALLL